MGKRKFFIALIIVIGLIAIFIAVSPQTLLKYKTKAYDSLLVEVMSVPKDTTIDDEAIGKSLMAELHIEKWDKYNNFEYKLAASRIIILVDDKYLFWIDELDETREVCKVTLRHGGISVLTGWYQIPKGTIEELERILEDERIDWKNLN